MRRKARKSKSSASLLHTLKNAYGISRGEIARVFAAFLTVWDILAIVSGLDEHYQRLMLLAGLGIAVLICAGLYVWGLRKAVTGNMTIPMLGRKVTLMRDEYQYNLGRILTTRAPEELERIIFVAGMDRSGNLEISSSRGILHDLIPYLGRHYRTSDGRAPIEEMQAQVDLEIQKALAVNPDLETDRVFSYGTCVEVKLALTPIRGGDAVIPCNLLLVANSRKEHPEDARQSEKIVDDDQSNIIIPCIFDYLHRSGYNGAMLGIMGSNEINQPYPVIFSQILNQYARVRYKNEASEDLQELFLSIREKDYRRWNVTLSQLESYVQACGDFYSRQTR